MQVARNSEMPRTIQFYRKLFLRAIKIKNKFVNAVLTTKLAAG